MSDRDAILAAITDRPAPFHTNSVHPAQQVGDDLWSHFQTNLEALGGRMIDRAEFESRTNASRWADPATGFESTAASPWDAEVGVSLAVAAIAQTGTLVFAAGPDGFRLSSLAPPTNLVVVDRSAIVSTLADALAKLPSRTTVFLTGPSRTADIEGVMVRGVHGPGELLVWVRDA